MVWICKFDKRTVNWYTKIKLCTRESSLNCDNYADLILISVFVKNKIILPDNYSSIQYDFIFI